MSTEQPGYSERDDEPITPQTGGDPEELPASEPSEQDEAAPAREPDAGSL